MSRKCEEIPRETVGKCVKTYWKRLKSHVRCTRNRRRTSTVHKYRTNIHERSLDTHVDKEISITFSRTITEKRGRRRSLSQTHGHYLSQLDYCTPVSGQDRSKIVGKLGENDECDGRISCRDATPSCLWRVFFFFNSSSVR